MSDTGDLRQRITRLRAERAALRVEAEAHQRLADERLAQSTRLTLEILELEELDAIRNGRARPFP
jgi:hypothetical protein